jgi:hypothetical protein
MLNRAVPGLVPATRCGLRTSRRSIPGWLDMLAMGESQLSEKRLQPLTTTWYGLGERRPDHF